MLIKLAKSRDLPVPEAVAAALDAGRKYINSLDLGGGSLSADDQPHACGSSTKRACMPAPRPSSSRWSKRMTPAPTVVKDGHDGLGRFSIMGLLMLAASRGTTIEVRTSGAEAEKLADALEALVAARFGEDY